MIGRDFVMIEKNELVVRGILYRMTCMSSPLIPGPTIECGIEKSDGEVESESEKEADVSDEEVAPEDE